MKKVYGFRFERFLEAYGIGGNHRVSPEAHAKLLRWGLEDRDILELDQVLSQYEGAYGNCPSKVQELARLPMQYDEELVSVPEFFSSSKRQCGGACSDLTRWLVSDFSAVGLFEKLAKKRIHGAVMNGHSPQFFCRNKKRDFLNHLWLGFYKDSHVDDHIVLDPSFQVFTPYTGSGYKKMEASNIDYEYRFGSETRKDIDFWYALQAYREEGYTPYVLGQDDCACPVLGLSRDGSLIFSLGFVLDEDERPKPLIDGMCPDGRNRVVSTLDEFGSIEVLSTPDASLSLDAGDEVAQMLHIASTFRYEYAGLS